MGFLDNLKSLSENKLPTLWQNIDDIGHLEQIINASHTNPIVIFKHSTTCGISAAALSRIKDLKIEKSKFQFFYLDLLSFRPISNQIALEFDVTHQSPQIIIIYNGKSVFDTSHHDISSSKIEEEISKLF